MLSPYKKNTTRGRKRNVSPSRRAKQFGGLPETTSEGEGSGVRKPIEFGDMWEKQEELSAGCGRHALNNLFGNIIFIEDDKSEITDDTFQNLGTTKPISLQSICRYLSKDERYGDKGADGKLVPLACPPNENYDNVVLEAALGVLGYKGGLPLTIDGLQIRDWKNIKTDDKDVIGYIVNFGAAHWVAYRKLSDGQYKYINSIDEDDIKHSEAPHGLVDTLDNLKIRHIDRIVDVIEIKFMGQFIGKMDGILEQGSPKTTPEEEHSGPPGPGPDTPEGDTKAAAPHQKKWVRFGFG